MYLFERLSEKYIIDIIPGISSPMTCSAVLKIPLVSRNEILTILPGPMKEEDLAEQLLNTDVAVIIKVGNYLPKIRRVLRKLRLENVSYYVERATMRNQKIIDIEKIESSKVPYFSMILVKKKSRGF